MKRIIMSLGAIVFVAAVAVSATGAFFSDTETSTGNTFTAGEIDLKIDNTSYVTNNAGVLVASPNNTWSLADLTNQLFFSFTDLKPGDIGEDTISVHAGSNDAWACMAAAITATPENTLLDPETGAGDAGPANGNNGELQNFLNFTFWNDDGDNVFETGETQITQLTGPASGIFNGAWLPLADSQNGPVITGNSTRYIGKAWCFGTLTPNPVAQDNGADEGRSPLTDGTGFTCNGAGENNIAQTDGISVDVSFQAVQARNNGQFLCSSLPPFTGGPAEIDVTNDNLETDGRVAAITNTSPKWFFYNDNSDVIDNALGTFVAGPAVAPIGSNSAQITLGANPTDRTDIATYAYQGTLLSSISTLAFAAYSHNGSGGAGPNESPYLVFDVDFPTALPTGYERRLVYVPSANGAVPQDAWNTYNTLGTGLWTWSGYADGPDKINGNADDGSWPDGDTNQYRSWNSILAAFPGIKMLAVGGLLGVRVGEPGPNGYIGNIDKFQINVGSGLRTYDFGN